VRLGDGFRNNQEGILMSTILLPEETAVATACSKCSKKRKSMSKRLPPGWKRWQGELYCSDCWGTLFVLRAIAVPIAQPLDIEWKDLRSALKLMWRQTTQASNWIMTELYARDVRRKPGDEKIPPAPRLYLYPEIRQLWPELPPQTVCALEQAVTRKYRARRFEVLWSCASSLPNFRYPTPFPVHNQSWSIVEESERPVVTARVGGANVRFRLAGGHRFRRQLGAIDKMIAGAAIRGELALFESGTDIMCKMVAYLPREERKGERTGMLIVRSMPNSLLVALNAKEEKLWTYHADHVVRWQAEHKRMLQRFADDQKFEQRPVPSFQQLREKFTERQRHRLKTTVQQIAASLVGYAMRRHFAAIQYNDQDHTFCEQFPWFSLRERIQTDCDEAGIVFEHVPAANSEASATAKQ
jgi:hypothetical protein